MRDQNQTGNKPGDYTTANVSRSSTPQSGQKGGQQGSGISTTNLHTDKREETTRRETE